jgi:hypothetical protein
MVESFRRSVTTTATLLYSHTGAGPDVDVKTKYVSLLNVDAAQVTVNLGPSGVTTSSGARWISALGRTLSIGLEPGESLYAIVGSGTQEIDVLVNGR